MAYSCMYPVPAALTVCPSPHPPSAGVSGSANRSGFPHSKLLVVPVVPVLPLSCHPTPHSRPTPPMGPSRITRKLSVVQGEKEVSE